MQETKNHNVANKKFVKRIIILVCIILILGIIGGLFILYGPYDKFRVWLITTSMSTMKHQYIARWLYNEDTINEVLNKNKVIEVKDDIDLSIINITDYSETSFNNVNENANDTESQILKKSEDNNDYKIIKVDGEKYSQIFGSSI